MWRAFFLAIGVSLVIIGAECLAVEKAVFAPRLGADASETREFSPPEWAPWSLMSAGAVVLIYSFTIPKKISG